LVQYFCFAQEVKKNKPFCLIACLIVHQEDRYQADRRKAERAFLEGLQ